jgi:predicted short-subunit dehydrogenase-like oxidoreductase (DUF2520 family)
MQNQSGAKPSISIVGPGRLGSALAVLLQRAGYTIDELVTNGPGKARGLADTVGAKAASADDAALTSKIIWLTVGDSAIRTAAHQLVANRGDWHDKIAFHSSGALTSDELSILREHGAAVASVHPLMTFNGTAPPSLDDVFFAIEGDERAVHAAESITKALGGIPMRINPAHKPAYHAWASFGSPLLVALFAAAESVGAKAGLESKQARRALLPLIRQTIDNYEASGAAAAFTGPLIRGDAETIRKHVEVLRADPTLAKLYAALANTALELLPVRDQHAIAEALRAAEEPQRER